MTTTVQDVSAWTANDPGGAGWVCDAGERDNECADRGSPGDRPPRPAAGPVRAVQAYTVGDVVVLEVAGRLGDVAAGEVDQAVRCALAEEPRAVLCDLYGVVDEVPPHAVEILASAGRYVQDWPGVPVAIACPAGDVRDALHRQPLSAHLTITASLGAALRAVDGCPAPTTAALWLPRHPGAPSAARAFVTRACLDWELPGSIPAVGLIARELVAYTMVGAATGVAVSLAHGKGCLRLAARRRGTDGARRRARNFPPGRRFGLVRVEGLSRSWGVQPTADGGTVVWAALGA